MANEGWKPERFGKYTVLRPIATGGMSTIHLAEYRDADGTRHQVAIKRLLPRVASHRVLRQSFVDEARLTKYLRHPNIAETLDAGRVGDTYYMAMEYVPGPTLKELIVQCRQTIGLMPAEITLAIAAQMCEALDHAHTRCDEHGKPLSIVHRDVSPGNVIVSDTGLVKLIDFGLAKAKLSTTNTGEGVIKGKFNYVAPEYLGGKLDARADLWAVGVVMYELLTARRLFDAPDDFETLARVRKLPIPRPSIGNPRVSATLDDIVMNALERDPQRRWQSAVLMHGALRSAIAQLPNPVDNHALTQWVRWLFTQEPGTEKSGITTLAELTAPAVELDAFDIETITAVLSEDFLAE